VSIERNQNRVNFEDVVARAKEIRLPDGRHDPVLIVEGSKKVAIGHPQHMPETHNERMEQMRLYGETAARNGQIGRVQHVFFTSEGWMSVGSRDQPPPLRPSQDPERKAVLLISCLEFNSRKKQIKLFEMIRNSDHQVVGLPELLPSSSKDDLVEIPP